MAATEAAASEPTEAPTEADAADAEQLAAPPESVCKYANLAALEAYGLPGLVRVRVRVRVRLGSRRVRVRLGFLTLTLALTLTLTLYLSLTRRRVREADRPADRAALGKR